MAHEITTDSTGPAWPPHTREPRPWHQRVRSGTREDRMISTVDVSLPPFIADRPMTLSGPLASATEAALREITALDHDQGAALGSPER